MCIFAVGLIAVGNYLKFSNSLYTSVEESNPINDNKLQVYAKIVQQNLPEFIDPFFGRVDDLVYLEKLIIFSGARIINICGPPAFGKSTLAIKLGKELLIKYSEHIPTVRYVDIETTRPLWYLCTESEEGVARRSLIANGSLITSNDADLPYYNSNNDLCFCQWLKATKERIVLILDNCELILCGKNREHFLNLIHKCFLLQKTNAVIILVSQQRLFMPVYGFFRFHIKELSLLDSRELLKHYVPNLSDEKADELSTAVGQCPLALKVTGKLLQLKGIDYLKILMRDLGEKLVDTVSRRVSRAEESFRKIMDAAYTNLEIETRLCSQFLSLFPGSTGYEMEKHIMKAVVNVSCIEDVVRRSFIEEILVGDEIRHSMHKLIHDYIREGQLMELGAMRLFNKSFISYYSRYLIQTMKHLYGLENEPLNDKESYTFNYLEIHNIEHFAIVATSTAYLKDKLLKTSIAIAFGLMIEENLMGSITEEALFLIYHLYNDSHVFSKLCATSSERVCASILWKTFINLADPECIGSPSALEKEECSKYFDCPDLHPFNYGRTFKLIQEQVKEKSSGNHEEFVLNKVEKIIYSCEATKILQRIWHSVKSGYAVLKKNLNFVGDYILCFLFSVPEYVLMLIVYVAVLPVNSLLYFSEVLFIYTVVIPLNYQFYLLKMLIVYTVVFPVNFLLYFNEVLFIYTVVIPLNYLFYLLKMLIVYTVVLPLNSIFLLYKMLFIYTVVIPLNSLFCLLEMLIAHAVVIPLNYLFHLQKMLFVSIILSPLHHFKLYISEQTTLLLVYIRSLAIEASQYLLYNIIFEQTTLLLAYIKSLAIGASQYLFDIIFEQTTLLLVSVRSLAIRDLLKYTPPHEYEFFTDLNWAEIAFRILVSVMFFFFVSVFVFGLLKLFASLQLDRRPVVHYREKDKRKKKRKNRNKNVKKEYDTDLELEHDLSKHKKNSIDSKGEPDSSGSNQSSIRLGILNMLVRKPSVLIIIVSVILCFLSLYLFGEIVTHYLNKFLVHFFSRKDISSQKDLSSF